MRREHLNTLPHECRVLILRALDVTRHVIPEDPANLLGCVGHAEEGAVFDDGLGHKGSGEIWFSPGILSRSKNGGPLSAG